jgi:hypothetical protein
MSRLLVLLAFVLLLVEGCAAVSVTRIAASGAFGGSVKAVRVASGVNVSTAYVVTTGSLLAINLTTAAVTTVTRFNDYVTSFTVDSLGSTAYVALSVYYTEFKLLLAVDLRDGSYSTVVNTTGSVFAAIAINPADGLLYALRPTVSEAGSAPFSLSSIQPVTGVVSLVTVLNTNATSTLGLAVVHDTVSGQGTVYSVLLATAEYSYGQGFKSLIIRTKLASGDSTSVESFPTFAGGIAVGPSGHGLYIASQGGSKVYKRNLLTHNTHVVTEDIFFPIDLTVAANGTVYVLTYSGALWQIVR